MAETSPEMLYAALVDLALAAAFFRRGPAYDKQRHALGESLRRTRTALDHAAAEHVGMDLEGLLELTDPDDGPHSKPGFWMDDDDD